MIIIPDNTLNIELSWPEFTDYIDGTIKSLLGQYVDEIERYFIFCADSEIIYTVILYKDSYEPIGWTQGQIDNNTTYRGDFEDNYQDDFNAQLC